MVKVIVTCKVDGKQCRFILPTNVRLSELDSYLADVIRSPNYPTDIRVVLERTYDAVPAQEYTTEE